ALLTALDALAAAGARPRVNLKFLFDGEEEQGSPYLEPFVRGNAGKLAADLMIVADGPRDQSGLPMVVFGARGIMTLTLTVYGPAEHLHSGHYGNWAPNPAMRLAALLASMKDDDGKVLIEGFYDDVEPLGEMEKQAIAHMPRMEAELAKRFGIGHPDGGGRRLPELITLPSLNVRGLESGWVGADARTVVPRTATAEIDVRLVRGNDHERMLEKIVAHIRKQGWTVVEKDPSLEQRAQHAKVVKVVKNDGYNAVRTPMDLPAAQAVVRAVGRALPGVEVLRKPTSGGSVPIFYFEEVGIPPIDVPTVNFDNNQHGPNENLRLGNFFQGIDIFAAIFLWE
ncbi:MAG: M20/M25/M40 family metallo-hydrolase, partial [Candidatus Acidiferrales bacterium]